MPIWRQPPQPTQPRPKVIESVDDPVGGRFDAIKTIISIVSIWAQLPQPTQARPKVIEIVGQPTMRRWGGSISPIGAQRIGKGW